MTETGTNSERGDASLNAASNENQGAPDDIDVDISESFLALQKLLKKREKDLDERGAELKRMKASLEKEHPTFGAKPSDVLRLNVGGTKIDVFRRTLTCIEGSLLASQFSGRWDNSLAKDTEGNFFVDHPIDLFLVLVNYLRDRECESHLAPPSRSPLIRSDDATKHVCFLRILEHYNLTLGVYPFSLYRIESSGCVQVSKCVYPGESIKNSTGSPESYALYATEGSMHPFHIKSYEVEVEPGSKAYIGVVQGDSPLEDVLQAHKEGAGVGYVPKSIAIDIARHGISFVNETYNSTTRANNKVPTFCLIEGTELSDSVRIRCEDFGQKWFVNGRLVAAMTDGEAATGHIDIKAFQRTEHSSTRRWPPVMTLLKGALRFTAIELEWSITSTSY